MAAADSESLVRLHITPLDAELIRSVIPAPVLPLAQNISYHTIETFPEKRYGFVELPAAEAEKIKKKYHGVTFKGSKMRIEKARPEKRRAQPTSEEQTADEEKKMRKKGGKKENKREKELKTKGSGEEDKDKDRDKDEDAVVVVGGKKSKKRKREVDVLEGVALKDRKVKRGWTEAPGEQQKTKRSKRSRKDGEGEADKEKDKDKDKDKKQKKKRLQSKYTEGEECLLKIKVPASAMKNVQAVDVAALKRKNKKKGGAARQVTVHEFEKTTKFPGFLRQAAAEGRQRAVDFVEGKGWVDEEGNVVEAVKEKERDKASKPKKAKPPPTKAVEDEESETSSDETSSDESSSEEDSDEEMDVAPAPAQPEPEKAPARREAKDDKSQIGSDSGDDTSSSGSSDDEADDTPSTQDEPQEHAHTNGADKSSVKKPETKTLALHIPNAEAPPSVHPLEALYKRAKPPAAAHATSSSTHPPIATAADAAEPFSFFGASGPDNNDEDDEADFDGIEHDEAADLVPDMPMTPFTRQDYERRKIRSAAPTPDTAHPPRLLGSAPQPIPLGTPTRQRTWDTTANNEAPNARYTFGDENGDDDDENDEDIRMQLDDADGDARRTQAPASDFQKWFWENRRELNRSWMSRRKTAAKEKRHRENKARASKAV